MDSASLDQLHLLNGKLNQHQYSFAYISLLMIDNERIEYHQYIFCLFTGKKFSMPIKHLHILNLIHSHSMAFHIILNNN
jgi:hypothetical protein